MSNTKRKHLRFTSHPGPVPCSAASLQPRCLPLGLLEQEGGPGQGARVPVAPGTSWSLLQGSTLPVSVRQQRKIFALKDLPAPCLCPACCRQTFPALPSWLQIPENCQPGSWCWGRASTAGTPGVGPCTARQGTGTHSRRDQRARWKCSSQHQVRRDVRLQMKGLCRLSTSLCLHKGVSWNYFGHLLAWSSASLAKTVFLNNGI